MEIDRKGVGGRAAAIRKRCKWSLRDVGGWAGLDPGSILRIERGERVPGDETVAKLAKGLRVTEAELLGLEPNRAA